MNALFPSQSDAFSINLTDSNQTVSGMTVASTAAVGTAARTEADKLSFSLEGNVLTASIQAGETIKAGSYGFKLKASCQKNGDTAETNPISFTVKVVNTKPTVKLSRTTLTLNSVFSDRSDSAAINLTDSSQTLSGMAVASTAAVGTAARAEADKLSFSLEGNVLTVSIRAGETIKTGSYGFKLKASCQKNEDTAEANPISFTVRVVNTRPTVKLSASTLSLNSVLAGREQACLRLTSATAGYSVVSCRVERTDTNAARLAESEKIGVASTGAEVTAMLDEANVAKAGSYRYRVFATVEDEATHQQVELAAVNFTVHVFANTNYSASVSASGKLDAAVRGSSAITYTLTKLNNVNGSVAGVHLEGKDAAKFDIEPVAFNAKGQPTARLSLKAGEDYATNVSYSVKLVFTLESGIEVATGNLTVRVTQTALKITAVPTVQTVYQSQSRYRTVTYRLKLTAPAGAGFGEIETGNVSLLQKSLVDEGNIAIVFEADTATVTVQLKDTSKLTAGRTYTLPLLIQAEGQATNLAPTKLNLNLKVAK